MSLSLYTNSVYSKSSFICYNTPSLSSRATTPEPSTPELDFRSPGVGSFTPDFGERRDKDPEFYFYDPTEPTPVFPPMATRDRSSIIRTYQSPNFSDHWAVGFSNSEWFRIWNGQKHRLDPYLRYQRSIRDGAAVPWTYEHTFKGAAFRITIDPQKSLGMPILTDGMVISVQNWTCDQYHYIVDHCLGHDDKSAYLKVICFDSAYQTYEDCSLRPPLILVAPCSHCNVRIHPNLKKPPTNLISDLKTQVKKCKISIKRLVSLRKSPTFSEK